MPVKKSYILAPNFDYPPGSSISIGNLLTDPFSPHRPLCCLPSDKWPQVTTTRQKEVFITKSTGYGADVSLGAHLLDLLGAKVGGEAGATRATEYAMTALHTEFFAADPDETAVKELLQSNPRARRALHSVLSPGNLFMITGLKIAEGLSVSDRRDFRRHMTMGSSAPVLGAIGCSVEAGVGGSRATGAALALNAEGAVVLAYRLVKISRRGMGSKELKMNEYRLSERAQMLSDDKRATADQFEIEMADAGRDDILTAGCDTSSSDSIFQVQMYPLKTVS